MSEFKFEEHDFEGKNICVYGGRASGKTTLTKDFLTKNSNKQEIGILNNLECVLPEFTNFLPNIKVYNSYHGIHSIVNGYAYCPELLVFDNHFYNYFDKYTN